MIRPLLPAWLAGHGIRLRHPPAFRSRRRRNGRGVRRAQTATLVAALVRSPPRTETPTKCLAPTAATPSVPTPTPPTTARMERYEDGTYNNNNDKDILRCHSYDQPTSQPTNQPNRHIKFPMSPLLFRLNGRYCTTATYMIKKVSVPFNSQSTNLNQIRPTQRYT